MTDVFAYNSIEEVKAKIREDHLRILDNHLSQFDRMFKPFVWEDTQPYIAKYFENLEAYKETYTDNLREFLKIEITTKLNFADQRFLRLEFIDEFISKNNNPDDEFIVNLISHQRMINTAFGDEVGNLMAAYEEVFEFEVKSHLVEGLEKEKIYLMSKWKKENQIFAFTTNNKIFVFDANQEKIRDHENIFGNVVAIDFFDSLCTIGNRAGNIFFINASDLSTISVFHFSL
jgi:hypothetical protein